MYHPRGCPLCDGDTRFQRNASASCNCENGDGGEKRKPENIVHYLELSQWEIMSKMSRSDLSVCELSNPGVSTRTTCRPLSSSLNLIGRTWLVNDLNVSPTP